MSDGSRVGTDWKLRFRAWWEGYELSPKAAAEPAGPAETDAAAGPADTVPAGNRSRFGKPLWTATRIDVAEKIWGSGFATPGGDDFIPYLVKPLGLNPAMSVLDMSAGLGGAARKMASTYKCWVTGLEASPVLAAAAMERSTKAGLAKQASVSHYDPENFHHPKRFDCILAKEFFTFVANREGLTDAMEVCLKPRGQLLFTDYVYEGTGIPGRALRAWLDNEPVEPRLLPLPDVVASLQQRNLDIRITEDITDTHRSLIIQAIQMLTGFLEKHSMTAETKLAVIDEVELWARRVAAMEEGLRCYRFFALKPNDGTEL
ncbi:MAG TPA: methyltransferase domain-containing protein [Arenibaculum sp.]|nr:methyltransferase domain-containing protein [Arenibaculum sp.]